MAVDHDGLFQKVTQAGLTVHQINRPLHIISKQILQIAIDLQVLMFFIVSLEMPLKVFIELLYDKPISAYMKICYLEIIMLLSDVPTCKVFSWRHVTKCGDIIKGVGCRGSSHRNRWTTYTTNTGLSINSQNSTLIKLQSK